MSAAITVLLLAAVAATFDVAQAAVLLTVGSVFLSGYWYRGERERMLAAERETGRDV